MGLINREEEILTRVDELAENLAFMPIGTPQEENMKMVIVITSIALKAGKTADLLQTLIEKFVDKDDVTPDLIVN